MTAVDTIQDVRSEMREAGERCADQYHQERVLEPRSRPQARAQTYLERADAWNRHKGRCANPRQPSNYSSIVSWTRSARRPTRAIRSTA